MRTFIAIELPEPVKEALGALSRRLQRPGERVTWVPADRIHLTLRFLGELDEEAIAKLSAILSDEYAGMAPFALSVAEVGAFPNVRRPSVIWAGVGPVDGGVQAAQAVAEQAARASGLPAEKKAFRPHLTLARIRDRRAASGLTARLEAERGFVGGEFTVGRVSLFSSELTPKGPIYRGLGEFPF